MLVAKRAKDLASLEHLTSDAQQRHTHHAPLKFVDSIEHNVEGERETTKHTTLKIPEYRHHHSGSMTVSSSCFARFHLSDYGELKHPPFHNS
jgi:hypothetical protein